MEAAKICRRSCGAMTLVEGCGEMGKDTDGEFLILDVE